MIQERETQRLLSNLFNSPPTPPEPILGGQALLVVVRQSFDNSLLPHPRRFTVPSVLSTRPCGAKRDPIDAAEDLIRSWLETIG